MVSPTAPGGVRPFPSAKGDDSLAYDILDDDIFPVNQAPFLCASDHRPTNDNVVLPALQMKPVEQSLYP